MSRIPDRAAGKSDGRHGGCLRPYRTKYPASETLTGYSDTELQDHLTRHGILLSYFQFGIRYCMAMASSRSWDGRLL